MADLTSQAQSVLTWVKSFNQSGQALPPSQLTQFVSTLSSKLGDLSTKVSGGGNNVTLFYSGSLGPAGSNAPVVWPIAEQVGISSGGSVTTIGQTEVGSLLNDRGFLQALNNAVGESTATAILNDGYIDTTGAKQPSIWQQTSQRLAGSASGNVITLTPYASGDKVFAQYELPELLTNPDVKSINGLPKSVYQQVWDNGLASGGVTEAQARVLSAVQFSSAQQTQGMSVAYNADGAVSGVNTNGLLEGTGISEQKVSVGPGETLVTTSQYSTTSSTTSGNVSSLQEGAAWVGEAVSDIKLAGGKAVASLGLDLVGKGGTILAAASTAYTVSEISDAINAGEITTANNLTRELVSGWTGGLAGAMAAGELAAATFSPLLAIGPVGGAAYVILVTAASVAGGYAGTAAVNSLLSHASFFNNGAPGTVGNNTTIDSVNWVSITKFSDGSILTQPINNYTDSNGILHLRVTPGEDTRQPSLQVPDGNGGFIVATSGASGVSLSSWSGQPSSSTQTNQIQSTPQTTDSETGAIIPATVKVYQSGTLQSITSTLTDTDGSVSTTTYSDPNNLNIQSTSEYAAPSIDSNGNVVAGVVTGTANVSQAIDKTNGSATYGQPLANTYNVTETGSGSLVIDSVGNTYVSDNNQLVASAGSSAVVIGSGNKISVLSGASVHTNGLGGTNDINVGDGVEANVTGTGNNIHVGLNANVTIVSDPNTPIAVVEPSKHHAANDDCIRVAA